MLHTFVDESYGEDDYYVAGVVVDDDQLVVLEAALLDLKSRISTHFGVVDSLELHAHEIMHAKGEWSFLHRRVHESVYTCRQVLAAVVDSGAVVHVQGVDVAASTLVIGTLIRRTPSRFDICSSGLRSRAG